MSSIARSIPVAVAISVATVARSPSPQPQFSPGRLLQLIQQLAAKKVQLVLPSPFDDEEQGRFTSEQLSSKVFAIATTVNCG